MKRKIRSEQLIWDIVSNGVMLIFGLAAIIPFILLVVGSFTDNQTAMLNGFTFIPEKFSLEAYEYIARQWATIGRSYLMTILVTVIGTVLSLNYSPQSGGCG